MNSLVAMQNIVFKKGIFEDKDNGRGNKGKDKPMINSKYETTIYINTLLVSYSKSVNDSVKTR